MQMVMIDIFILAKKIALWQQIILDFFGKNLIINSRKIATNLEKNWRNFKTTKLNFFWSCDI
jgi:hypothetical protein